MGPKFDHVQASYASHWLGRLEKYNVNIQTKALQVPEPDGNAIAH